MAKRKSRATRDAERQEVSARAAAVMAEQRKQERRRRNRVVAIVVVVVLGLLLGIGYAVQSSRDTTGQVASAPSGVVDEYAVPRGSDDAPVTVTIYEDFMCPFCREFEAASRETLDQAVDAGDARVEYRVLSFLDRASNGTEYSTRAMNALGVVLDTAGADTAIQFHNLLFENQPAEGTDGLSDDELVDLAVEAGAARSDVAGPIEDRRFAQWVVNATNAANQAGVSSTPTVLVDGEPLSGATIDDLVAQLDERIQAAAG
jgi:protein-disulfide isomerase